MVSFGGTFAGYEHLFGKHYGSDIFRYLLTRAKLNWTALRDRYNRWVVITIRKEAKKKHLSVYVIIDDMLEEKDKRSRTVVKGGKKKEKVGFSFVTCVLRVGWFALPLIPQIALRKEVCVQRNRHYVSKLDLANKFLDTIHEVGLETRHVIVLLDSWYTGAKVLNKIHELGYEVIGAVRKDRKVNASSISQWSSVQNRSAKTVIRQNSYKYKLSSKTGTLTGLTDAFKVLISERQKGRSQCITVRYILCSDVTMSVQEILRHYQNRWLIETFHQIWQHRFGLKNWQLKGMRRQRNLIIITVVALGFSVYYFNRTATEAQRSKCEASTVTIFSRALEKTRLELIQRNSGFTIPC